MYLFIEIVLIGHCELISAKNNILIYSIPTTKPECKLLPVPKPISFGTSIGDIFNKDC